MAAAEEGDTGRHGEPPSPVEGIVLSTSNEDAVATPQSRTSIVKVVGASLVGTTVEWYDFFLYGSAAALVFNKLFFPDFDPLMVTLLSFATYAVGFASRPIC